ncbi:MAG TPA: hypothetical protein ENH20_00895 [Candidatus Pacearchaeota archaeon]|nr:hypothetical protein [Candidatus Pacearchaeota archaeon]
MEYGQKDFNKGEEIRLYLRNICNPIYKIAIEGTVVNPDFTRMSPTGKESGIEIMAKKKAIMKNGKFDLKKAPGKGPSRILYHNIYDVERL